MSTTVLSNLQQVEAELAAQQEAIEAQLQEVRNKLKYFLCLMKRQAQSKQHHPRL